MAAELEEQLPLTVVKHTHLGVVPPCRKQWLSGMEGATPDGPRVLALKGGNKGFHTVVPYINASVM
jgi:hypothetical protein